MATPYGPEASASDPAEAHAAAAPPAAAQPAAWTPSGQPADDQPLYGAGFIESVVRFYKRYVTFSGRASRSEYWWIVLYFTIVYFGLGIPTLVFGLLTGSNGDPGWGAAPFGLLLIVILIGSTLPNIALIIRRLHDANLSGLLLLINFFPYLGALIVFILNVLPSSPAGVRFDSGAKPGYPASPAYAAGQFQSPAAAPPAPPAPPAV